VGACATVVVAVCEVAPVTSVIACWLSAKFFVVCCSITLAAAASGATCLICTLTPTLAALTTVAWTAENFCGLTPFNASWSW